MSATPDSTLANPEQRIADLERQLAEREAELAEAQRSLNETTTERDQALEQQTATAEVLGVINSSPGNLTPVFDAMLEKATRLCEAPFGILRTWDGECFHLGAVHGNSPRLSRLGPAAWSHSCSAEPGQRFPAWTNSGRRTGCPLCGRARR